MATSLGGWGASGADVFKQLIGAGERGIQGQAAANEQGRSRRPHAPGVQENQQGQGESNHLTLNNLTSLKQLTVLTVNK